MTRNDRVDVTVIVPAYDAMPYLTGCLNSVLGQSIGEDRMEIVAVDDGSTDGTGAELDRFAAEFPGVVRVLHQENSGGPAGPRNTALDLAAGRYVFFLDADDELGPQALEQMVGAAERNGTDVVLGRMTGTGGRRTPARMFRRDQDRVDLWTSDVYWTLNPVKLFRRELLTRLGLRFPTDLPVGEDQVFCARAYLHADGVSVVAGHECVRRRRREDGGNLTDRVRGAEPRVRLLQRMFDLVTGELPEGPRRDRLLHRHLAVELHGALLRATEESVPEAERARLLHAMRRALSPGHCDSAARRLPAFLRLEYHLLRDGRYPELLHVLSHLREALAAQGRSRLPVRQGLVTSDLVVEGPAVYARYPYFRDPVTGLPDDVFDVTRETRAPHWRKSVKHILIRSGKSPFHVATPAEYIQQDLLGTNNGNLLFSDAAQKALSTPGTLVTSNGIRTDKSARRAAEINEQYDVFVVPLANAFRRSFEASLDRLSTLIEQLTIPVVVLGVGAQVPSDYDTSSLDGMADSVRRFVKAVLKRSASIGVRGELTAEYLKGLGFDEVDIIGCPSMFLHGDTFPELDNSTPLTKDSRIAINISHDAARVGEIAAIASHTYAAYPDLTYYPQNLTDAELLFWGDTSTAAGKHSDMPDRATHELLRDHRARLPIDPVTWMKELSEYDFAFGTRIHGNIAALLAGTPSVVLCHDSRTLELCRYFDIPHRMLQEMPADLDPAQLHAEADYTALRAGHRERFERFTAFLDKNGLENTWTHGDGGAAFDARLAETEFPPTITMWDGTDDGSLGYRFAWLREQAKDAKRKHASTTRRVTELAEENGQLREQLRAMDKRAGALEKRLDGMERRVNGTMSAAVRRRARKVFRG